MAKIFGTHIPAELKNHVKNGALDFWQEKGSTTTTVNTAAGAVVKGADMMVSESGGPTVKNYSTVRSTDVPSLAQSGFNSTYSYLFTMITGIASPATADYVVPLEYRMEGFDYEKIHTKTVTFGFWVKASVAGTYSFALQNGSTSNRSYVTTFSVTGSNTWQFVTITVTLDNTGTWAFDNTSGLNVYIGAVTGSGASTSTLNQWQAANVFSSTTATNWQATTGATFQFAQFSIVEGSLGLGATGFARCGKDIQQELALCQRYYEKSYDVNTVPATNTTNGWNIINTGAVTTVWASVNFRVNKRAAPTPQCYSRSTGATSTVRNETGGADIAATVDTPGETTFRIFWTNVSNTVVSYHWTADARL